MVRLTLLRSSFVHHKYSNSIHMKILSLSAIVVFAALLCCPQTASAQYQRSIINTGFESNDPRGPGAPNWQPFPDTAVPGWLSTTGVIEEWDSTFLGVTSYEGVVHAELNANSPGALYQEICLVNGDVFNWTFAHRARSGGPSVQNITFEIANSAGSTIQILGSQSSTVPQGWNLNSASGVSYTGPSGIQRVQFRTTDPGSYGNFLDGITIILTPFLEFSNATGSGSETNPGTGSTSIVVSGDVASAFNVVVSITGGTATLGDDYTTPSGTATFNVSVPAGNYVRQLIPLGITIVDDTDVESTETIEMSIAPVPASYTITSSSSCGGSGQASATYSIIDNDSAVTMNKQWIGAVVGDEASITVSNGGLSVDTFSSVAGSANELDTDPTPTPVAFGDTIEFAETLDAGNAANYVSALACTGAADTDITDGLTIAVGESAVSCTYSNTRSGLAATKSVEVVSDGVSLTDPKAIPGATIRYCILTTNIGQTTAESVVATDALPSDVTYVAGSMLSGTSCAGAATPEDDNDVGADESDPFGISISGTTITGFATSLAPGSAFSVVFDVVVD